MKRIAFLLLIIVSCGKPQTYSELTEGIPVDSLLVQQYLDMVYHKERLDLKTKLLVSTYKVPKGYRLSISPDYLTATDPDDQDNEIKMPVDSAYLVDYRGAGLSERIVSEKIRLLSVSHGIPDSTSLVIDTENKKIVPK